MLLRGVALVASFVHLRPAPQSLNVMMRQASSTSFRNPHNLPTKVCVVCDKPFTW